MTDQGFGGSERMGNHELNKGSTWGGGELMRESKEKLGRNRKHTSAAVESLREYAVVDYFLSKL